jgi:ribosome-associated translation inhibitor RaiA
MIIQFKTGDVTFFDDDQAYFEKRLNDVVRFLGSEAGDEDSVKVHVTLSKNRHNSGERFEAKAHMTSPHGGDFMAEANSETIKALADAIKDILETQARKFHSKHLKV